MMKKLLLTTAACGLVVAAAAPAHAEIDLSLGGYFKGYGAYVNQDEITGADVKTVDFIRDTEVHFTGETTLDNGLTVGFHVEAAADGEDAFGVDESYAYFSGGWGRINFGDEDGAAYLLQVAAPAADDNIDGVRQFVQPLRYDSLGEGAVLVNNPLPLDYAADPTGKATKLTYLTPVLNGFQAGASYSPDTDRAASFTVGIDDEENIVEETYEVSARYEGQFNNVGVILGAGFTHGENGADLLPGFDSDDRQTWNVGADFDIGAFGIGAAYLNDNHGREGVGSDDENTWVVGADYTTGPFKFGVSYLDQSNTEGLDDVDVQRYSGGVTYTYGPGMTFRGSVGHVEHDQAAIDADGTYVTLGTQINF